MSKSASTVTVEDDDSLAANPTEESVFRQGKTLSSGEKKAAPEEIRENWGEIAMAGMG